MAVGGDGDVVAPCGKQRIVARLRYLVRWWKKVVAIEYMEDHNTKKILSAITGLTTQVGGLTVQVGGLSGRMDQMEKTQHEMSERIDASEQNVLEAISELADHVEGIDTRLTQVDARLTQVDTRLIRVEATMVTKSYLDDKLGGLKGDMVALVRKEDEKVNSLI